VQGYIPSRSSPSSGARFGTPSRRAKKAVSLCLSLCSLSLGVDQKRAPRLPTGSFLYRAAPRHPCRRQTAVAPPSSKAGRVRTGGASSRGTGAHYYPLGAGRLGELLGGGDGEGVVAREQHEGDHHLRGGGEARVRYRCTCGYTHTGNKEKGVVTREERARGGRSEKARESVHGVK
jgi:hypothetical protein